MWLIGRLRSLAFETDVDGGAVGVQAFRVRDGADGRREGCEAVAREPLDLDELAELLDGERARRAGETARRQDVVRARRVVAGGFGRPAADEEAAGVADPGDGGLEVRRRAVRPTGAPGA